MRSKDIKFIESHRIIKAIYIALNKYPDISIIHIKVNGEERIIHQENTLNVFLPGTSFLSIINQESLIRILEIIGTIEKEILVDISSKTTFQGFILDPIYIKFRKELKHLGKTRKPHTHHSRIKAKAAPVVSKHRLQQKAYKYASIEIKNYRDYSKDKKRYSINGKIYDFSEMLSSVSKEDEIHISPINDTSPYEVATYEKPGVTEHFRNKIDKQEPGDGTGNHKD